MPVAQIKLSDIAGLIQAGQDTWDERWKELREDFNEKHKENVERRHTLMDRYANVEGRVTVLERDMRSVIGDSTGDSGMMHKIDEKVDKLQEEFSGIKKVLAFLAFLIMAGIGILALVIHH